MAPSLTSEFKKAFLVISIISIGVLFATIKLWAAQIKHQRTPALRMTNTTNSSARALPSKSNISGQPKTLRPKEDPALEELLQILQSRIQNYSGPAYDWTREKCSENTTGPARCYDTACLGHFSSSLKDRLQQVLSTRTTIPAQYLQVLASAARPVTSHKYIFVTGASSDHYNEMQALLDTMFKYLFPRMEGEDYAFVIYNLGLAAHERKLTEKHCRCTVIDFPFDGLPDFVRHLTCYAWKPLVVASLQEKAEYLVWMDASVRWKKSARLEDVFRKARASGYLARANSESLAVRSQESMAQFFGDHLCQYAPFGEMMTGLGFYYNDRIMREVILPAWLSCAFNTDCLCLKNYAELKKCRVWGTKRYGTCHRYEQSAMGMILSKLFLENRHMLEVPKGTVSIQRNAQMSWFESA